MRMASIAAVLAMGLLSLAAGGVDGAEPVAGPAISVTVTMPGTDAGETTTRVTMPLEDALGGLDEIAFVASFTRAGESRIVLKFRSARDDGAAIANVRTRVARVRAGLPPEAAAPVVSPFDRTTRTVAYLAFSSDRLAPATLTEVVERIKDRLPFLVGVDAVRILGRRRPELRLGLDTHRLEALGVSLAEVQSALRPVEVELRPGPGGKLEAVVASRAGPVDPRLLGEVLLAWRSGAPIRLRDVAQVSLVVVDDGIVARFDRRPAVILEVSHRPEIDVAEVARGLRDRVPAMLGGLPAGTIHEIAWLCARCADPDAR
jgi:multidrug efflux pump subunit AcrB